MAKKERKYWAKSMVLARTLGIPYRQNDLTVNVKTGKILIRAAACKKLGLDDKTAIVPRAYDLLDRETLRLEAWTDEAGALPYHLTAAEKGSGNMVTWWSDAARAWGRRLKVKDSIRLKVCSVIQLGPKQRLLEARPVTDMAELCKRKDIGI